MSSIRCWPDGYATRSYDCDAELPDSSFETMERYGWGFGWGCDPFSDSGQGPFLMCPEHRGDCTEKEREDARRRYREATAASSPEEAK